MARNNSDYMWKFLAENDCVGVDNITKEISKLIVKCPWEGCEYRSKLRNMQEHERVCERQQLVGCPYGTIGCQENQLINYKMNEHLVERNESHAKLLLECVGRLQNEIVAMNRDIATLKVERREQQDISDQQAERIDHLDREMRAMKDENESMKREIVSLRAEIETDRTQFAGLVRERSEMVLENVRATWLQQDGKFDHLEQQTANEKEELLAKIDEVRRVNQARCDEAALRVRENWINVENCTRGEFMWHIDYWSARRVAARHDTRDQGRVFSDVFCLHKQGYRMCLSVRPAGWGVGDNYLYTEWQLMRGPFDEHLPWPFKGSVTLSLINQQTRLDHASFTVTSDQYPKSGRWDRPITHRNNGFYSKELVDVNELSRDPSLSGDDQIFIRCVVEMGR